MPGQLVKISECFSRRDHTGHRYRRASMSGRALGVVVVGLLLVTASAVALAQGPESVTASFATTTDAFRVLDGGLETGGAVSNLTEFSLTVDSQALWGRPGGTFFLLAARAEGDDPGERVGSVHAPSNLAADDDWYLLEGWYEQRFAAGRAALLGGVYAVDSEFDARASAEVFTNGAFGTGLDLSETGMAGPGIFPQTGLGLRLRYALTPFTTLRVAAVDGEPMSGGLDEQLQLRAREGALLISELDYQPAAESLSRYAVGAWRYSEHQERLDGDTGGSRSWGAYGFWEGDLFAPAEEGERHSSAFVRAGASAPDTGAVNIHISAGVSVAVPFSGRVDDVAGIALSWASLSGDLDARSGSESVLEVTYAFQAARWLRIQPVLQYTVDPVDSADGDALLAGVRLAIGF